MSMNKSELIAELAARFPQLVKQDAEFAVKAILDAINDAMTRGHRVELRGFGSFTVTHRLPRIGRNPRSGIQVSIPEKNIPRFKPGKSLRESIDTLKNLNIT